MLFKKCQISILVILAICFSFVSPINAGFDDDVDGHGDCDWDMDNGCGWIPVPLFWPDFDFHRGRALVQMPGTTVAVAVPAPAVPVVQKQCAVQQTQAQVQSQVDVKADAQCDAQAGAQIDAQADAQTGVEIKRLPDAQEPIDLTGMEEVKLPFPHAELAPSLDKHGRRVIKLDHGSKENPQMVYDHGLLHIGLLLGAAIVEPHTGIQFNFLSKWQLTKGEWSLRYAANYEDACKMKWGKAPKKISDFDKWEIGDWQRKNGIVGLTLYAGVGWFSADARAGAMVRGVWSRTIEKSSETLIRVGFTREVEGGPVARLQLVPLQKSEVRRLYNSEDTRVYLFDISVEDDRKALEYILNRNMLPAKSSAEELVNEGKGSKLTTRDVSRKRTTVTPMSFGIPFIFRMRYSNYNDSMVSVINNNRNDADTVITAKSYLRQRMHRHVNGRRHEYKKWKHFMHTHQHFDRSFAGIVATAYAPSDRDTIVDRTRHLDVQVSFSHDNVKVKKVNKYLKRISASVGLNDVVLDTDYKKGKRIGNVQINYKLKVGDKALKSIVTGQEKKKRIFTKLAHNVVDDYFVGPNADPHGLCDSSHPRLRQRCIRKYHEETIDALRDIEKYLHKLKKEKVEESDKKSAKYLALISKKLATNQFVLHTFLRTLPHKETGYGKLEVFGQGFIAKRIPTDPNKDRGDIFDRDDVLDDGDLVIDRERTNAGEEGNDLI